MNKKSKIYVVGSEGLVGSAIVRALKNEKYANIVTKSHKKLDLLDRNKVFDFYKKEKPEYVILAAAKVGGIDANILHPAQFLIENVLIQNNVILGALNNNVKRFINISCGCAYPTHSKQPIKETYLLEGKPEITNEGFAIAKILGIKMCENISIEYKKQFMSCICANTYGPNDHFEVDRSHVIPALIQKFHYAKIHKKPNVTVWGSGSVLREYIYVDDLARAVVLMLIHKRKCPNLINIGSGQEISIKNLAKIIKKIVKFKGAILFDKTKQEGMKRRILDSSKINKMGFNPAVSIEEGIVNTYSYFLSGLQ